MGYRARITGYPPHGTLTGVFPRITGMGLLYNRPSDLKKSYDGLAPSPIGGSAFRLATCIPARLGRRGEALRENMVNLLKLFRKTEV